MLMCLVVLMASMFQLNQIQLGNHKNWIAVNREREKKINVKFKKKNEKNGLRTIWKKKKKTSQKLFKYRKVSVKLNVNGKEWNEIIESNAHKSTFNNIQNLQWNNKKNCPFLEGGHSLYIRSQNRFLSRHSISFF